MNRWFGWVKALRPREFFSPLTTAYLFVGYTVPVAWYAVTAGDPLASVAAGVSMGTAAGLAMKEVNDRKKEAHARSLAQQAEERYKAAHGAAVAAWPSGIVPIGQSNIVHIPGRYVGLSSYGGHRGGAQAHRVGAFGGSAGGAGGASAGTGAGVNEEFAGLAQAELEDGGFAAGSLRGVRSFSVDKLGRLTGIHHKQVWTPDENVAECRALPADDIYRRIQLSLDRMNHIFGANVPQVPAPPEPVDYSKPHSMLECKHGFYAYYDGSDDYHDTGRISAVVEGYGECVVGTRGFRSMKARILALHIPDHVPGHVARLVPRNYPDVPVFDSFDRLVSEFPPDTAGLVDVPSPDTDPDFWTRDV